MADWAKNILQVDMKTDKKLVDALFASIAGKAEYNYYDIDLVIDFNKIVPVPDGDEGYDWKTANINVWGTKGCYAFGQYKLDDYTIGFLTAWVGVPELMLELSRQNPRLKLHYFCCLGCECDYSIGAFIFQNGEILSENTHEHSTECFDAEKNAFWMNWPDGFYNPAINEKRKREIEERKELERLNREKAFEELVCNCANLLKIAAEDMNLSVRSYNCLKRAGVNTVADIIAFTHDELLQVHNFNRKCVIEVTEKIEKLGLRLKSE
jgi:pyrimidine deaminase RibD-like protein